MKRAASFNPVYPFEEQTQPNTALPPFFSSDGLEEKPGGTLGLKITNPLGFDLDGNLKLKLGEGMRIDVNGALENAQTLTASKPLEINSNDELSLKMNTSSFFVNGSGELDIMHQQSLSAEAPLAIEQDKIVLKINPTLTVRNGQLQISFHASPPLNIVNQNLLQLDLEQKGLKVENSMLKLKLQSPLYFTPDNLVGLERFTMWTGNDTSNNAILDRGNNMNARLELILNKVGNLVMGMIRVNANGLGSVANVDCMIYFNSNGVFDATRSNLKSFGFKKNYSIDTNYTENLKMMPDSTFYPRHNASYDQNLRVYDRVLAPLNVVSMVNDFYTLKISYNQMQTGDNGYSLYFKWNARATTFNTTWTMFSYLAAQ
ncbi:fiber [Bat mastadenovirus WIV9]|uniref:Fiber n=1 Tax=Bat mastadenovirus WIV9 TaxID=1788436 RepID=A0A163HIW8_9ADEN|nr:fiber [Bat mastadenovirus WIV9]AMB43069.1 fiber [Bat mastadenovirus WIV9]